MCFSLSPLFFSCHFWFNIKNKLIHSCVHATATQQHVSSRMQRRNFHHPLRNSVLACMRRELKSIAHLLLMSSIIFTHKNQYSNVFIASTHWLLLCSIIAVKWNFSPFLETMLLGVISNAQDIDRNMVHLNWKCKHERWRRREREEAKSLVRERHQTSHQ